MGFLKGWEWYRKRTGFMQTGSKRKETGKGSTETNSTKKGVENTRAISNNTR